MDFAFMVVPIIAEVITIQKVAGHRGRKRFFFYVRLHIKHKNDIIIMGIVRGEKRKTNELNKRKFSYCSSIEHLKDSLLV